MKKVHKYLLILLHLLLSIETSAQYYANQNKIWTFGTNAGIDFTSGSPIAFHTSLNTTEGCASVSSPDGHLLFYTDGKTVYNRAGGVMPSGSSIVPFNTTSTQQAALIIPVIGNEEQYYLFSLSFVSGSTPNFCTMAYCIVDMTLDGGMGDIVIGTGNTPLADSLSEDMIAITGNDNNIWLLTHLRDTSLFLAYSITSSGVGAPVISNTATHRSFGCYVWGMLKASPNRQKVARALYKYSSCYGIELFDFDPNTGILSNPVIVDTVSDAYGIEFSPDNSKLYVSRFNGSKPRVYQYDISLPTPAAIAASKYTFIDTVAGGDLKLGPDKKIYFNGLDGFMGSINYPNLSGASCGYTPDAVLLSPGTQAQTGLPNLYVTTDTSTISGLSNLNNRSNVTLFPVPARDNLIISAKTPIDTVAILNIWGHELRTVSFKTAQAHIDVSDLPPGIYLIRINDAEVNRFVKQ